MSCSLAGAQLYGGALTEKAANFCAITTCAVVIALLIGGLVVVFMYAPQIKRIYHTVRTVEDYVDRLQSEGTIDKVMQLTNAAADGVAEIEQKIDQLFPKTSAAVGAVMHHHPAAPVRVETIDRHHGGSHGRFNSVASSYW